QVQCVTDPIANGGSNSFVFSATSPAPGFVSSAAPVTVIGNEEDPNPGGATLTVTPAPTHLTTSGIGPDPQTTTVAKPGGATLALLDGDGNPATTVTVPGVGTYVADPTTGVITFTPVLGYVGTPAGVEFLVTGTGGTASGDYTPTVLPPNPPLVPDLTTTGVSAAPQQATLPALPSGGSATLLDGDGNPATTVTVPGQGTYVLSGGVITFTPAPLYVGTATAVTYRVTDAYNQSDTGTYTPTVTAPAPPVALPFTSTGAAPDPQSPASPITIPAGGSVTLLDGDGNPATSVTVPGQGTYTLNTTTGVLTFTPVPGYTGTATAVTYRVTDAYGQSASSTYTPTVTPPPAPSAPDETTSGVGTAPQTATFPVPTGGSITLLDGDGNPATTPVTYRVTDAYGQTDTGTHTPTVTAPAGPSAPPFTSTGPVSTDQQVTLPIPTGGIVRLLDGDGDPVTTVTVPGVGTYVLVPATGVTTFTPAAGYSGTAPAVGYRVTDACGQSAASPSPPTPPPPAPPAAPDRDTTQTGTATHTTAVSVPSGGSVTLLDGDGNPATTVTIPGQGSYVLDPATGAVTFTPVLGFSGPATPVDYRVTDAYGQTATGTYSPTVLRPPAPSAAPFTSSGATGSQQSPGTTIPVPAGGTVRLLDASGNPVATMTVPGQGTYSLDPATGALTFTPTAGFTGTATAVTYQVTDAYGQSVSSTYTAVVTPAPAPTRAPSGALAATGGAPLQLVGFGAALVIGGALLVLTSRRRTAQATVSS
ncbi:MAG TPA: Ig-like domain-containing protein, partial [Actinotalea sp.]|nr:Ig-like domain-containing protein [Actinotalea sp.]